MGHHALHVLRAGLLLVLLAMAGQSPADSSISYVAGLPENIRSLYTKPDQLGLDPQALEQMDAHLQQLAADQVRSGYVAMIARNGRVGHWSTAGFADVESRRPMSVTTPFRIASMTKPVTAVAVMILVEQGRISLDDRVSQYLPRFADVSVATSTNANDDGAIPTRSSLAPMTIRHLMTHTSGLGYVFDLRTDLGKLYASRSLYEGEGDLAERIDRLPDLPLYFEPGARWQYSYANDVLGNIVAVAAGQSLSDFMRDQIFMPLKMIDTTFFPDEAAQASAAQVYRHTEEGKLVLAYSPERPETLPSWEAGGSGLISTAADYMRFALMMAGGGELEGVRVLRQDTVEQMIQNHVEPDKLPDQMKGFGYGLGVGMILKPEPGTEAPGVVGDYGWGGYFDTDFFVSPKTGLVAVLLTQEEPGPQRPGGSAREVLAPLAYAALSENASSAENMAAE